MLYLYFIIVQEGQNRKVPFLFATVKGYTGHQESAAGAVGLIEATHLVQRHALPPALHLRNLNPHVYGSLARHPVSIARGGPYPTPTAQQNGKLLVGVSSFGAQGTNAHALVSGTGTSSVLSPANSATPWKSTRFWVAPQIQTLLAAALVRKRTKANGGGVTVFEVDLAVPRLAYLWEYNVSERPYLPSSGVLALAASSIPVLSNDDTLPHLPTLLGATLPAPLMLPGLRRGPSANGVYAALTVKPALASVEIVYAQQKVLVCRLGSIKAVSSSNSNVAEATEVSRPSAVGSILAPLRTIQWNSDTAITSGIFGSTLLMLRIMLGMLCILLFWTLLFLKVPCVYQPKPCHRPRGFVVLLQWYCHLYLQLVILLLPILVFISALYLRRRKVGQWATPTSNPSLEQRKPLLLEPIILVAVFTWLIS